MVFDGYTYQQEIPYPIYGLFSLFIKNRIIFFAKELVILIWKILKFDSVLGIMQQLAISEATLFSWNSVDGESMGAYSNRDSITHLSEVNQESITSRGTTVSYVIGKIINV